MLDRIGKFAGQPSPSELGWEALPADFRNLILSGSPESVGLAFLSIINGEISVGPALYELIRDIADKSQS